MDVGQWLGQLGLAQYAEAFQANDIDLDLLPDLNEADLEKLGISSLGHRKRLLKAIHALASDAPALKISPAPIRPHEAERRQLTVVFCDLVGSTALAEQLDPEDLRDVIRTYQDACAGVVSRFEGYIAKYVGDGLLIYFGYPKAHEDDAERAVRASLGVLSAVTGLRIKSGQTLAVRIGVATGVVVVGDIVGEGAAQEEAVLGETPNLAARLQGLAGPNSIVISAATRDLIGENFESRELGPQALKGFSKPIQAWEITGDRAVESRFQASHGDRLSAFLGREQELQLLMERWERARAGEGQLVMLSGEAGIGKSRITEALKDRVAAEERWSLHYQCSPHYVNSPLYPAIQQLQFAAGIARDEPEDAKLNKLEVLLSQSDSMACLPLIAALLSISTAGRYEPVSLPPAEFKQQMLRALIGIFEGLAEHRPTLFVVEDAHWLDPTTRDLLDLLAERVKCFPALMLVTHRPEFTARWTSYAHCTPLALSRLGRAACAALVDDLTGSKRLPAEVLNQIIAKTDGIPLFVEELTKTVLESGLLVEENGAYTLRGPLPPLAIPSTLQDSLMARLDRLNGAKEVAQIGAATGREFSHSVIEAVATLKGSSLDTALETLIHSEIIYRRGEPPEATYIFKHALIQDTAYESLLRSKRQQIHGRIAAVLKAQDVEPEVIAHHFTQAGLPAAAAPEWVRAGQRAVARSANAEAIVHLTHGLEVLQNLSLSDETQSLELDMQISMGTAQIAMRGYSATETERTYSRARELLQDASDDPRHIAVLNGLAIVYYNRAQLRSMNEVANQMAARVERSPDRVHRIVTHRVMAISLNTMGRFEEARQEAEKGIALYIPEQDCGTAYVYGHDMGVGVLWHLAVANDFLGDAEGAQYARQRAEDLVRTLNHANTTLYSALWSTFTMLVRGEWSAAHESAARMITDAERRSMALWSVFGRHLLGCALAALGEPEPALAELSRARREATALENRIFWPMTLMFEGQALADLGQRDAALDRLDEAIRTIQETEERWWEAEAHRIKGEIMRSMTVAPERYESECRHAIEIAVRQKSTLLQERAANSLRSSTDNFNRYSQSV
jgi:class 3 adenylate cyclase/tetratricopeptide (TPR) repeat protein